jgi:hypothetical protein
VHGIGVSSRYFVRLGEELAGSHAVSIPDLRGFGKSDGAGRPLSVLGLADALLAFLEAVGLEWPQLVATSMGCQVVAALAARHPGRVGPLRGERDGFISQGWAEEAVALLPRGQVVVVPAEPRAVHYTRTRLVAALRQVDRDEPVAPTSHRRASRGCTRGTSRTWTSRPAPSRSRTLRHQRAGP